MNELYWISVMGKLNTLFWIAFGVSVLVGIILFVLYLNSIFEDEFTKLKKPFKLTVISLIVCGLAGIIIPGKNEAYLIYGAGTIMDYCKDRQKVKEIPDKAVDALNRYLDSISEDKNK